MNSNPVRDQRVPVVWRWLARLLILTLAPVLVLYSTNAAQASTTYGDIHSATAKTSTGGGASLGRWMQCTVAAKYFRVDLGGLGAVGNVKCDLGWNLDLTGNSTINVSLLNSGGGLACAYEASWSGSTSWTGTFSGASTSSTSDCHPDSFCIGGHFERPFLPDTELPVECVAFTLGTPPDWDVPPPAGCSWGSPVRPSGAPKVTDTSLHRITQQWTFAVQAKATAASSQGWTTYLILSPAGTTSSTISPGTTLVDGADFVSPSRVSNEFGALTVSEGTEGLVSLNNDIARLELNGSNPELLQYSVVGSGIYRNASRPSSTNAAKIPYLSGTQMNPQGQIGVTNPGICSFYWGRKIADLSGSTYDEPIGPVDIPNPGNTTDTPPVAGDPTVGGQCDFSITDPSTWASGGICALVGLIAEAIDVLGNILNAILGLADIIANAIADALSGLIGLVMDGLTGLFVPPDGTAESIQADLTGAMDGGNLGDWKAQVTSGLGSGVSAGRTAAGSPHADGFDQLTGSGGCEGPTITWSMLPRAGLPATINPFSACSGQAADMAGWSRLILTVLVGVGGFMKGLQMLMLSLNLQKQIDILGSHDWTNGRIR